MEHNKLDKILLDCNDYLANKSRVPMHTPMEGFSITDFLSRLHLAYTDLFVEGHAPSDGEAYSYIDALLARELIKTSQPVKVVELGSTNGRLSYHLATVLGRFHLESSLCCVCDSIGNESGNFWLDMISLVERPPKLSLHACDYDDTNLCNNHFDIVIINGSVAFADIAAVLKEALKLVKTNGALICYACKQPELADYMRKIFAHVDEYNDDNNSIILFASTIDVIEELDEIAEWKKEFQQDFAHAEALLISTSDKKELFHSIQQLNHHADIATANQVIDVKCKALELKEKLLVKYVEL
ncbi:MAG: class I SAM-dependent methyltransferase [Agathobacter sp.]|nr:class I SAM-dependent methyltransferase [Agathobacter sp.]